VILDWITELYRERGATDGSSLFAVVAVETDAGGHWLIYRDAHDYAAKTHRMRGTDFFERFEAVASRG
jgi:hypothetical protein